MDTKEVDTRTRGHASHRRAKEDSKKMVPSHTFVPHDEDASLADAQPSCVEVAQSNIAARVDVSPARTEDLIPAELTPHVDASHASHAHVEVAQSEIANRVDASPSRQDVTTHEDVARVDDVSQPRLETPHEDADCVDDASRSLSLLLISSADQPPLLLSSQDFISGSASALHSSLQPPPSTPPESCPPADSPPAHQLGSSHAQCSPVLLLSSNF